MTRARRAMGTILSLQLVLAGLSGAGARLGFEQSAFAANPKSNDEVKYAPDRVIDIEHVALDVTPDFEKRDVRGSATISFAPISKPLEQLRLDAVDLTIASIKCSAALAGYQSTREELVIDFAEPINPGQQCQVVINYSAHPLKGLFFRVPSNGYSIEEMHLFTQGEMTDARHWFPSYDYPNEKFTSEITCHVPQNMSVLSNGRQVSSVDERSGLKAVRWLQDKPHANYLITLVAGNFKKLEDKYGDVPLSFYTLPSDLLRHHWPSPTPNQ